MVKMHQMVSIIDMVKEITWLCSTKCVLLDMVMWTRQLSVRSLRMGICVVTVLPSSATMLGRGTARGFSAFSLTSYQNSPDEEETQLGVWSSLKKQNLIFSWYWQNGLWGRTNLAPRSGRPHFQHSSLWRWVCRAARSWPPFGVPRRQTPSPIDPLPRTPLQTPLPYQ